MSTEQKDRDKQYLLLPPKALNDKGGVYAWIDPEHLKQILARALNTWDNAPPEVKELHDIVVHGWVMQDYKGQKEGEEK